MTEPTKSSYPPLGDEDSALFDAAGNPNYRLPPVRVIEVTIGLFSQPVEPGQYPPVLAAEIVAELALAGYRIVSL
jgi:hypothetical protein